MPAQSPRAAGRRAAAPPRQAARRPLPQPAPELPVARVAVDISLPHLDRPFDYLVPAAMAADAVPGAAVRVRFSGKLAGGYILERLAASEHEGRLGFLQRVPAPEPVLTPEIAGLARAVADRYGGTLADVLRLAIPPRHAAAARAAAPAGQAGPPGAARPAAPGAAAWDRYAGGRQFLAALAAGRSPRAVWSALPGPGWAAEIAAAAAAAGQSGRGSVIVVPDARDLQILDAALTAGLGPGRHVVLTASLGPAERYRRWIAVARGAVQVAAGTRSAMFAPVASPGLVVVWDEGDDLHAEPRAPYPHAREVLALRAYLAGGAALIGGYARTAEAQLLISSGWARPLAAGRAVIRQLAPATRAPGADAELARDPAALTARLPGLALRTARAALAAGPVLVQVPRRGYLAAVACERCHAAARCECGGPAQLPGRGQALRCGWCGSPVSGGCRACGHGGLRALAAGAARTAEELGAAFGGVTVRTSGGAAVLSRVGPEPALVVATPGAEPAADGGYGAAILLDGWALLGAASLRAAEEALRRWMNAAALVRPAAAGGSVVVVADSSQRAVQALVRWDPATFAGRELAERAELRFPPAARMAAVAGPPQAAAALLAAAALPDGAEVLGPLPAAGRPAAGEAENRYLIRVPRSRGSQLAAALAAGQAARSAAREPGGVRVRLDPAELI